MRILGIDPGIETTGCGIIEANKKDCYKVVKYCWISTDRKLGQNNRLKSFYFQTRKLIEKMSPDVIAIERLFFYNNQKTAMEVSQSVGVIKLAIADFDIESFEYSPPKIKAIVAKNGRAKKEEVIKAVKKILGVRVPKGKKTHFNDVADALGIAVCHAKIIQEGG